jgi:hypothetical protein
MVRISYGDLRIDCGTKFISVLATTILTPAVRPMYHWTEQRIRAHVFICVMALQMQRAMRSRLSKSELSVEPAIQRLQTLKAGTLETPGGTTKYLAALQDKHKEVFEQLQLPFPKLNTWKQLPCSTRNPTLFSLTHGKTNFPVFSTVKLADSHLGSHGHGPDLSPRGPGLDPFGDAENLAQKGGVDRPFDEAELDPRARPELKKDPQTIAAIPMSTEAILRIASPCLRHNSRNKASSPCPTIGPS